MLQPKHFFSFGISDMQIYSYLFSLLMSYLEVGLNNPRYQVKQLINGYHFWVGFVQRSYQQHRTSWCKQRLSPGSRGEIKFRRLFWVYDTDEMGLCGEPICVNTLSSHCSGPCKCTSIQQGVLVTSCLWYSAPQPFTNDMLQTHDTCIFKLF